VGVAAAAAVVPVPVPALLTENGGVLSESTLVCGMAAVEVFSLCVRACVYTCIRAAAPVAAKK
jgi:hypothetical protein